jgi:aspartyl-tRNA(Asn)/glutamyl-tRNA(Gln) amidotransferase subunit C
MSITPEEVLRVAELAHLELTEDELNTYRRQLDGILAYIDKLGELDVSAIEPMAQTLSAAAPGPEILRQAPDGSPPWFRVPRVIFR